MLIINILNDEEIRIITLMEKDVNTMQIKEYEAVYTYDYDLDVVNIEINEEYVHGKTIDLAFGVFLDFDENRIPVNIEIVSASKITGIQKELLMNPDGNMAIIISEDMINVEVTFEFTTESESLKLATLNDYGFPNSEINLAFI